MEKETRKIRIFTKGSGAHTKVFLDGEDIGESLESIDFHVSATGMSEVEMTLFHTDVEIEAEALIFANINGRRYQPKGK